MITQDEWPESLLALRDPICGRCVRRSELQPSCPGPGQPCSPVVELAAWLSATTVDRPQIEVYLAQHANVCRGCALWLILHAVHQVIPAAEIDTWLDTPTPALACRTPRACITDGDYLDVIAPLWQDAAPGPVS